MNDDYLWAGSGEPDPELKKIEQSLSQFGHSGRAIVIPAVESPQLRASLFRFVLKGWALRYAASFLVVVALIACALLVRIPIWPDASNSGWGVTSIAGAPLVGRSSLSDSSEVRLKIGQSLVTDADSRAFIRSAEVGEVYVDAGSRVRLLEAGGNRNRIYLDLGTIHAAIWAPPGEFQVDTPSASVVDLGCAYTLHVEPDGSGSLRTTLGWVGFHRDGRDSFIPAGAVCSTHPVRGPGTPYFEDASQAFRDALHSLDFSENSIESRKASLPVVLAQARARDAFTLWHLLSRVGQDERPLVYERLASLVPPPARVTRAGVLSLDPVMLDAWWNAFDLGDISVWRYWEQQQAPNFKQTGR